MISSERNSLKSMYLKKKLKCWPYWNDKNLVKFGSISAKVNSNEDKIFYEKRKIEIKFFV